MSRTLDDAEDVDGGTVVAGEPLVVPADVAADAGADERHAGPVVAADVDRAVALLAGVERCRTQAALLLGGLEGTGLAQWLGYVSLDRLIAHRTGCGNAAARELVGVSRHLERFPATAAALVAGELGWAHVEVLARAAGDDRAGAYGDHEAELLAAARGVEPEPFGRLVQTWRARVDAELDAADAERSWKRRSLTMQFSFDGSCHGRFRLDPVGAAIVAEALDSPPDPGDTLPEPRTLGQRRADELVEVCRSAAGGGSIGESGRGEESGRGGGATVDVVVDVETLADGDAITVERLRRQLLRGGPISGPGLDRLLCDASFRAIVTDGPRAVLAYNRATPDIPPALRRAVRHRDQGCTFHGCDRGWTWCDVHHLIPRARNGPTDLENLTLLCRFHHGAVHEGRWQLTRAPDGTILTSSR